MAVYRPKDRDPKTGEVKQSANHWYDFIRPLRTEKIHCRRGYWQRRPSSRQRFRTWVKDVGPGFLGLAYG